MPSLTPDQVANLLPLAEKYKKEGFSSDVGKSAVCHLISTKSQRLLLLVNLINQKFYPEPYCSLVDTAPTVCYEESLLELWARDGDLDRSVWGDSDHMVMIIRILMEMILMKIMV